MAILDVQNIEKHFGATQVLQDISFSLEEGQALAIIGSSGSGKTTLLRCLNFLETPDHGRIRVRDEVLFDADDPSTQRESEVRRKRLHFGMVFQSFNLFPQYTALQNVTLAKELLSQERPDFKANKRAILEEIRGEGLSLLEQMGLSDRAGHYPHQLSGGQCQRLAIARALLHDTPVYIFDEATSNIDAESEEMIMDVIHALAKTKTVILISHRLANVVGSDRIYMMTDGRIPETGRHEKLIEQDGEYAKLYRSQMELEQYGKEAAV